MAMFCSPRAQPVPKSDGDNTTGTMPANPKRRGTEKFWPSRSGKNFRHPDENRRQLDVVSMLTRVEDRGTETGDKDTVKKEKTKKRSLAQAPPLGVSYFVRQDKMREGVFFFVLFRSFFLCVRSPFPFP